jgi:hypothetical protein
MLMISASENFLVESDCFLHNKICPFLAQGICIYVGHFFKDTQLEKLPLYTIQLRVRNSCVEGEKVKCSRAIAGGEEPI